LFELSIGLTSIQESFIRADLSAVSKKGGTQLSRNSIKFVALSFTFEKQEMSHHEVLHKFLEDGIVSITNHLFKILNKFLEHFS